MLGEGRSFNAGTHPGGAAAAAAAMRGRGPKPGPGPEEPPAISMDVSTDAAALLPLYAAFREAEQLVLLYEPVSVRATRTGGRERGGLARPGWLS